MKELNNFIRIISLFGLVFISFTSSKINAQEKAEITERKPILLLEESSRWVPEGRDKTIWQLNNHTPNFVLYNDGLVIFKKSGSAFELFSVQLTPQEMNRLLQEFNIGDEFMKLKDIYYTNQMLHQPMFIIKYWQVLKMKRVAVYGPIRISKEDRNNAPKAFLKLFDQMVSFHHENASLWEPEKVEITVYPFKESEGEPVQWPKEWPDLNHKTTTKGLSDGSYYIYLDGDNKAELEQILSGLKENQAIVINGKNWLIWPQKYCLPSEELWINK